MNLDNARNTKAEILSRAFGYTVADGPESAITGLPSFVPTEKLMAVARKKDGPMGWDKAAERMLAVGIANVGGEPNGSGSNTPPKGIVIFGQRQRLRDHPIVQKAIQISRGEARFIYTGPIQRAASYWSPDRRRPLAPGCSIAHVRVTAGTLGCFVDMGARGGVCVLSNNHVLADSGRGKIGDMILQPGRADGGSTLGDVAGVLHFAVPLLFDGAINRVDCAVATIMPGLPIDATACAPAGGPAAPRLRGVLAGGPIEETEIVKVGRTTGVTFGRILATEVDKVEVNYGSAQQPKWVRFDGQITGYSDTAQFGKRGDSGSVVMTREGDAVGLLFAVSERGAPSGFGISFMNPIELVLRELDATLWIG